MRVGRPLGADEASKALGREGAVELAPPLSVEMSGRRTVPAASLKITGARVVSLIANESASRYSDRVPGIAVHYALTDGAGEFTADWAVVLRQGSSYIRQVLTIKAGATPVPVSAVTMIDVQAEGIELTGSCLLYTSRCV